MVFQFGVKLSSVFLRNLTNFQAWQKMKSQTMQRDILVSLLSALRCCADDSAAEADTLTDAEGDAEEAAGIDCAMGGRLLEAEEEAREGRTLRKRGEGGRAEARPLKSVEMPFSSDLCCCSGCCSSTSSSASSLRSIKARFSAHATECPSSSLYRFKQKYFFYSVHAVTMIRTHL